MYQQLAGDEGAKADSECRKILDYFNAAAIHIGEPIFTYSLKQGIEDGLLAPYKFIRSWKPARGMLDLKCNLIPNEIFSQPDFDKILVIDEQLHAERVRRALINENADIVKEHSNYIMKITGDDDAGKKSLDYFIDPTEKFLTIATISELMTIGVDCKTYKLIVIDKIINSPIIFKQIIGSGTRLFPDFDKNYFTIMDFRNTTRLSQLSAALQLL